MARRIKSLRDAEDVVTLLLQLLVIWRRRLARKVQVHIIQFSPTTTISFYCKLQKHGVLMVLCRASLPLLSCSTAAAVTAYAGRNRPARPVAGAVAITHHCEKAFSFQAFSKKNGAGVRVLRSPASVFNEFLS